MLVVRCKSCGKVLEEHPAQLKSCQCSNRTSIRNGNISGVDLSLVEIVSGARSRQSQNVLSKQDLEFQEQRRQRKVKRLDFEIR